MNYLYNFVAFESDQPKDLQSYQLLVKHMIRPLSPYKRVLISFSTGTGKTLSALLMMSNFTDRDKQAVVVTFQQSVFQEECVKFGIETPIQYFGYIQLLNYIVTDQMQLNTTFIKQMIDGVMVFDEIHKSYNRTHDNIQFKTILFLCLILRDKCTFVYLSATPLTYADEIRDLLRLLQKPSIETGQDQVLKQMQELEYQVKQSKLKSREVFIDFAISKLLTDQDITDLTPITPQLIMDTCRNAVFYIPDLSNKDVPRVNMRGQKTDINDSLLIELCPSPDQFVFNKSDVIETKVNEDDDSIAYKYESLRHIQIPVAGIQDYSIQHIIQQLTDKNKQVTDWCTQHGIELKTKGGQKSAGLGGSFMQIQNLGQYSPKYAKCIQYVLTKQGKSFIYMNTIQYHGVDFMCQALRENGILEHNENVQSSSICFNCRQLASKHDKHTNHSFVPYRFFRITGQQGSYIYDLLEQFNSTFNAQGQQLQIIVGSRRVMQGFNFLAVNNVYIVNFPYNMANMIQVLGRAVRNKSHQALPIEQQYVDIHFLVNSHPEKTSEEQDIYTKNQDYNRTLQYEALIHKVAIDVPIYGQHFMNYKDGQYKVKVNEYKMIPFEHEQTPFQPQQVKNADELMTEVYNMRDYYTSNIGQAVLDKLRNAINDAFVYSQVWTSSDLVEYIRKTNVYPSMRGLSTDSILAVAFANPNVTASKSYIYFQKQNDSDIILGMQTRTLPDIDFFLPHVIDYIKPLQISNQNEQLINSLVTLLSQMINQAPIFLISILQGQLLQQTNESLLKFINVEVLVINLRQILQSSANAIATVFEPIHLKYCPTHTLDLRIRSETFSTENDCKMCITYQKQLEELKGNINALKLIFTYLTHTIVTDSETGHVQGFLSQDHSRIYRFDTMQWNQTHEMKSGVIPYPLIMRNNGNYYILFNKIKYTYKNITSEVLDNLKITNIAQFVKQTMVDELTARLMMKSKKYMQWHDLIE